jgi:hypothetical protein
MRYDAPSSFSTTRQGPVIGNISLPTRPFEATDLVARLAKTTSPISNMRGSGRRDVLPATLLQWHDCKRVGSLGHEQKTQLC